MKKEGRRKEDGRKMDEIKKEDKPENAAGTTNSTGKPLPPPTQQKYDLETEISVNSVKFKIREFTTKFNIPPTQNKPISNHPPPSPKRMLSDASLTHWKEGRPRIEKERGNSATADGKGIFLEENLQENL